MARYRTGSEIWKSFFFLVRDRSLLIGMEEEWRKGAQFWAAEKQHHCKHQSTAFTLFLSQPNLSLQSLSSLPRVVSKLGPSHSSTSNFSIPIGESKWMTYSWLSKPLFRPFSVRRAGILSRYVTRYPILYNTHSPLTAIELRIIFNGYADYVASHQ